MVALFIVDPPHFLFGDGGLGGEVARSIEDNDPGVDGFADLVRDRFERIHPVSLCFGEEQATVDDGLQILVSGGVTTLFIFEPVG